MSRLKDQLAHEAAQMQRKFTPKPEASGILQVTSGQVARWFVETYREEFDDPGSPLYGQSTEIWQHIVTFLHKHVKPDPRHPDASPETRLHLQIIDIFEREFLPLFFPVN